MAAIGLGRDAWKTRTACAVADNWKRNYGPAGSDRRHIASIYYAYDFPKFGKKLTHSKAVSAVVDGWNLSGITGIVSGAPFTPSMEK